MLTTPIDINDKSARLTISSLVANAENGKHAAEKLRVWVGVWFARWTGGRCRREGSNSQEIEGWLSPEVCIGVSGVLPPPSRPPLGSRPRRSQRGARGEYEGGNHIYAP